MKKLLTFAALIAVSLSSCKYDDDDLWNSVNGLEGRVAKLEELCKQMNTNISSLQTIVTALQSNDYITNVIPITKDGATVGYTITFAKSNSITIYNGTDGKDGANGADGSNGKDGSTPTIGVKQDTDGIYYWTLNGSWLTDEKGNKVKAQGTDGKDGVDGEDGKDGVDGTNGSDGKDGADGNDGTDGTNGKDGFTPKFKIENGYWYISYDNETTWTQLGKATGDDGKDGVNGDSVFKGVTQDDNNVYFELADGTIITIAKFDQTQEDIDNSEIIQFKDAIVKAICVQNWDTNKDGELSRKEAAKVTSIKKFFRGSTIQYFDELQYFIGIEEIESDAFRQCFDLKSVTIPDNVLWIDDFAFFMCNNLKVANISNRVIWIGEDAFNGCGLTNIELGNNVSIIGDRAFYYCSSLTNITMPESVIRISHATFTGCTSLTSITIPKSVISIGNYAFDRCSSLNTIYFAPIDPPVLNGGEVFYQAASNITIYVPSTSVNKYKTADVWKEYATQIVGYDFTE